jgi:succinyl-CoA synthetase beta subunit
VRSGGALVARPGKDEGAMNFEEHAAKPLLRAAGIEVPKGALANSPSEAAAIAATLGSCVVKAQVPTGKRGISGGIAPAGSVEEARVAAARILGMTIAGHRVERVLVEEEVAIAAEMYAAVLNDPATKGPLLLYAPEGGIDVEAIAREHPHALVRIAVDIHRGVDVASLERMLAAVRPGGNALAAVLARIYGVYAACDAELLEINPLVVDREGRLIALDCKLIVDDSAMPRQQALLGSAAPDRLTALEARGRALGLNYVELDGDVGVLANGAGLTMATMDAVRHYGGQPANFLEIGGDNYTKAKPALELVLANRRVQSLLVNFCGAFARTDVMVEGVIDAWRELKPAIPVFFSIHGTNEDEAVAMVRERLRLEPFELMDEAVQAAIAAAQRGSA